MSPIFSVTFEFLGEAVEIDLDLGRFVGAIGGLLNPVLPCIDDNNQPPSADNSK